MLPRLVLATLLASMAVAETANLTNTTPIAAAATAESPSIAKSSIQGAIYLDPHLVTTSNVPLTFMQHFIPLITPDCLQTCQGFTSSISHCNDTATSDAGLSACLCGDIDVAYACTRCVADGTQPDSQKGTNNSVQAAAAVVLYDNLVNACQAIGIVKVAKKENVTIIAAPTDPPKDFNNTATETPMSVTHTKDQSCTSAASYAASPDSSAAVQPLAGESEETKVSSQMAVPNAKDSDQIGGATGRYGKDVPWSLLVLGLLSLTVL